MPVERREQVIRIGIVRVNGKPEELDGRDGGQQSSMGGTSRMSREAQVRICERLGVQFPGATRRQCWRATRGNPVSVRNNPDRPSKIQNFCKSCRTFSLPQLLFK